MKLCEVPYDFSINILEEKLREYKPRNILIQSANGLKKYIPLLVEYIGKILPQSNILVSDSPTYGGCDVAEQEAILVNADVVIHVGHAKYHEPKVNVIFIEARSKLEVNNNVLSSLVSLIENRGIKSVSIVSTIQHIHEIVKVKNFLEENNLKVIIGPPVGYSRYYGHVLGCEYSPALRVNDAVEGHVIICGGAFHPIGLGLATGKPVIKVDPYENRVIDFTTVVDRILKLRYYTIYRALDAKRFGVIVGSIPGQYRPNLIEYILSKIRSKGLEAHIIVSERTTLDSMMNIDSNSIDAYIVTSCPRLPIDDLSEFHKPVLTPGEAKMVLDTGIEEYVFPW